MNTKEKIFDCALALFSQKGFDGVSIRDIAKAVGIKESSIYNHYDGKKSIIDEICLRFADTLSISRPPLTEIESWLESISPKELFKKLITAYGGQINPQITQMARTVFAEQFHHERVRQVFMDEFITKNSQYYAEILTLLENIQKIKPCNKLLVANLFNNAQLTLSIQYMHCQSTQESQQVREMMLASVDFLIGPLETV